MNVEQLSLFYNYFVLSIEYLYIFMYTYINNNYK